MPDCFALLNQPRRPWIDPDVLKETFLALSSPLHPDRVHGAGDAQRQAAQKLYTELNAAYNCLRDPKTRLHHLLELERGAPPPQVQSLPPDLMDMGVEIGRLCRQVDAFLAEKATVTSPLLQVRTFEQSQDWTERVAQLRTQVNRRHEALTAKLRALDTEWATGPDADSSRRQVLLERLEQLYRLFGYYARWHSQLQERFLQLSF